MFYFDHAWCIYILTSSYFNLQIRTVLKKIEKKWEKNKNFSIAANSANVYCSKKEEEEEENKWSWINEVLLWGLDLRALVDFVDIRGFGFTTCA